MANHEKWFPARYWDGYYGPSVSWNLIKSFDTSTVPVGPLPFNKRQILITSYICLTLILCYLFLFRQSLFFLVFSNFYLIAISITNLFATLKASDYLFLTKNEIEDFAYKDVYIPGKITA
jgi:hypothetical protein